MTLNAYGLPITPPEYFDGEHAANPTLAGLPPVCSCGWTPHGRFHMSDHLADMDAGNNSARLNAMLQGSVPRDIAD